MMNYEYEEISKPFFAHPSLVECRECDITFVEKWKYNEESDQSLEIKKGVCKHCSKH